MSLFKQRIGAVDVGVGLAAVCEQWTKQSRDTFAGLFTEDDPTARKSVNDELSYFVAFVCDFATFLTFGNGPIKDAVLQAFYATLCRVPEAQGGITLDDLEQRLKQYSSIVSGIEVSGVPWSVATAFVRACGYDPTGSSVTFASTLFNGVLKSAHEFLHGIESSHNIKVE